MEKDYYNILGITEEEKNLSEDKFNDVLKKKYRKLAFKWHPDKFAQKSEEEKKDAEDRFKDIAEAYDTLSDPDKKMKYDNKDVGFDDIFSQFNQNRVVKGNNVEVFVDISLKDAFYGKTVDIEYDRQVVCHHCGGTGSEDGKKHECPECKGTGYSETISRNGMYTRIFRNICSRCGGKGHIIENECPHCNGTGMMTSHVKKTITVPKGVVNGMTFIENEAGSEPNTKGNKVNGDLLITFRVSNVDENGIQRVGDSLAISKKTNIKDALLGGTAVVTNIDGEKLSFKIPEITKDGKIFSLRGKGMPIYGTDSRGELLVRIEYDYPKSFNNEQKKHIRKAF